MMKFGIDVLILLISIAWLLLIRLLILRLVPGLWMARGWLSDVAFDGAGAIIAIGVVGRATLVLVDGVSFLYVVIVSFVTLTTTGAVAVTTFFRVLLV